MKVRVIGEVPGDVGLNGIVLKGATRQQALQITQVAAALQDVQQRKADDETLRDFRHRFEQAGLLTGADFICWIDDRTVRIRPISRRCLEVLWPFMPPRGLPC